MNKNQKIECKAYKATFYTDITCIRNQIKIKNIKLENRKKYNGTYEILFTAHAPLYYKISKCDGCIIGEKLYQKAKEENRLDDYIEKRKQGINANVLQNMKKYYYLQKIQIDSLN